MPHAHPAAVEDEPVAGVDLLAGPQHPGQFEFQQQEREVDDHVGPLECLHRERVASRPSARPREISSRSDNVDIARTAGILSHRSHKIKCFDRLSPGPRQDSHGEVTRT